MNCLALRHTSSVVALDRFMAERVQSKVNVKGKMHVIPPWPHEDHLEPIPHAQNDFRRRHGLDGKRVVMYSGNHSSSNPLWTILDAARELRDDPHLMFVFVGGGLSKKQIEEYVTHHGMRNVLLLPYQPFAELRYSLSAADVHIVSLGEQFVGILHPCKAYGAMACERPLLYLGPDPSHFSEMLNENDIGWRVAHGDVPGAVQALLSIRDARPEELAAKGATARRLLKDHMDQTVLRCAFCDSLEQVAERRPVRRPNISVTAGCTDTQGLELEPSRDTMNVGVV
jgi:glycosyltransferase involved in cell wall biosynthesis